MPLSPDFEAAFAAYLGVGRALAAPSARWGLFHLLRGLELRPGDEVLVPAFTYFAVPAAVRRAGLKPVFVDLAPRTLAMDPERLRQSLSPRSRVVIPTHLSGLICDLGAIVGVAREHGLAVIEDCSQSLGGKFQGRWAGAWGQAAYFTFGITKHFTTLGGAMVVAQDHALAEDCRRSMGSAARPRAPWPGLIKALLMKAATSPPAFPLTCATLRSGFGGRIVERLFSEPAAPLGDPDGGFAFHPIQAALGLRQLRRLQARNRLRRGLALRLRELVSEIPGVTVPRLHPQAEDIFSTCPVFVRDKERVRRVLLEEGIDSSAGYMDDCSSLELFPESRKDCPEAARVKREVLYLPLYADLPPGALAGVARALRRAV
jgi:dTDP-4-amino-4,6-dideoxygalactose transaminase